MQSKESENNNSKASQDIRKVTKVLAKQTILTAKEYHTKQTVNETTSQNPSKSKTRKEAVLLAWSNADTSKCNIKKRHSR